MLSGMSKSVLNHFGSIPLSLLRRPEIAGQRNTPQLAAGWFIVLFGVLVAVTAPMSASPVEIHLGVVGNPFDKPIATGILGYAQEHRLFETEFANDGIAIKWDFYKGTGPAINEGLANGGVDITSYGDLPGILGKRSEERRVGKECR